MAHSRHASTSASPGERQEQIAYDRPRLRHLTTVLVRNLRGAPAKDSLQDLLVLTPHRPAARRRTSTASFSSISTNATLRRTPSSKSVKRARSTSGRARASSVASKRTLGAEDEEEEGNDDAAKSMKEEGGDDGEGQEEYKEEASTPNLWTATWDAPRLRMLLEQRESQCFVSLSSASAAGERIYATSASTDAGLHHAWGRAPSSYQAPSGIVPALDFSPSEEQDEIGSLDEVMVTLWAKAADKTAAGEKGKGRVASAYVSEGQEAAQGWTNVWQRRIKMSRLKSIQADQLASPSLQLPDNVVLLGLESPLTQVLADRTSNDQHAAEALETEAAAVAVAKQQPQRRATDTQIRYYIVDSPTQLAPVDGGHGQEDPERTEADIKTAKAEIRQKLKAGALVRGYEVEDVLQLLQLQREVTLVLTQLDEARKRSDQRLLANDGPLQMQLRRDEDEEHVKMLKSDRDNEQEAAKEARRLLAQRREALNRRRARLETARRVQATQRRAFEESQTHLTTLEKELDDVGDQTHSRRVTLLRHLELIYPIDLVDGSLLLFSIVDIPLPNRTPDEEERVSKSKNAASLVDDDSLSSALGLVGQLVSLLSVYLETPVHYPIATAGSRAVVEDGISVMSGPRAFPLYQRGVEQYRFEYACFLVNKDVEQMMNAHGITVLDIRHTLPNLKNLLVTLTASSSPSASKKKNQGGRGASRGPVVTGSGIDGRSFMRMSHLERPPRKQETISLLPSSNPATLGKGPPPAMDKTATTNGGVGPAVAASQASQARESHEKSSSTASSGWNLGMSLIWGSGASSRQQPHPPPASSTATTTTTGQDGPGAASAAAALIPTVRSLGRS